MIGPGTFGKTRGGINLNQILIALGDRNLTQRSGRLYSKLTRELKLLQEVLAQRDYKFYRCVIQTLRNDRLASMDRHQKRTMPYKVFSHLRCTIVALYRDALTHWAWKELGRKKDGGNG